ncbi:MAG: hypothetical protein AAB533_04320 [Patescibacteria group bacterium]
MKKALLGGAVIAVVAWAGWHYGSPRTREALLGFIGMARRRDTAEIRRAIGDAVLPEDPVERRVALTQDLTRSIRELRRREATEALGADAALAAGLASDETLASTTTADVLAGAERIIKELEGANTDSSAGTKVVERILERMLPARQCKE